MPGGYRLDGRPADDRRGPVRGRSSLPRTPPRNGASRAPRPRRYRAALALWRGDVLEDLGDHDFVAPVRARLDELRRVGARVADPGRARPRAPHRGGRRAGEPRRPAPAAGRAARRADARALPHRGGSRTPWRRTGTSARCSTPSWASSRAHPCRSSTPGSSSRTRPWPGSRPPRLRSPFRARAGPPSRPGPASRPRRARRTRLSALTVVAVAVAGLAGGATLPLAEAPVAAAAVPANAVSELDENGPRRGLGPGRHQPDRRGRRRWRDLGAQRRGQHRPEDQPVDPHRGADHRGRSGPARDGDHRRRPVGHQLRRPDRDPDQHRQQRTGGRRSTSAPVRTRSPPAPPGSGWPTAATTPSSGSTRSTGTPADPSTSTTARTAWPWTRPRSGWPTVAAARCCRSTPRPAKPDVGTDPGGQRAARHRPLRRRGLGRPTSSPRPSPGSTSTPGARTRSTSATAPPTSPSSATTSGWRRSTPGTSCGSTASPPTSSGSTSVPPSTASRSPTAASGWSRERSPPRATSEVSCASRSPATPPTTGSTGRRSTRPAPTTSVSSPGEPHRLRRAGRPAVLGRRPPGPGPGPRRRGPHPDRRGQDLHLQPPARDPVLRRVPRSGPPTSCAVCSARCCVPDGRTTGLLRRASSGARRASKTATTCDLALGSWRTTPRAG